MGHLPLIFMPPTKFHSQRPPLPGPFNSIEGHSKDTQLCTLSPQPDSQALLHRCRRPVRRACWLLMPHHRNILGSCPSPAAESMGDLGYITPHTPAPLALRFLLFTSHFMASQWSESVAGEWLIPSQLHLPTSSKGDVVYLFLSECEQIGALPSSSWAALHFLSQGCSTLDQRPADGVKDPGRRRGPPPV